MISQESVRGIEKKYHKNFIVNVKHVWGVKYRLQTKGKRETADEGTRQTTGKIPTADQGYNTDCRQGVKYRLPTRGKIQTANKE